MATPQLNIEGHSYLAQVSQASGLLSKPLEVSEIIFIPNRSETANINVHMGQAHKGVKKRWYRIMLFQFCHIYFIFSPTKHIEAPCWRTIGFRAACVFHKVISFPRGQKFVPKNTKSLDITAVCDPPKGHST